MRANRTLHLSTRASDAMTETRLHELAVNLAHSSPDAFEANARGFLNAVDAFVEERRAALPMRKPSEHIAARLAALDGAS